MDARIAAAAHTRASARRSRTRAAMDIVEEDIFPKRRGADSPARREQWQASAFDQSNFTGARALS